MSRIIKCSFQLLGEGSCQKGSVHVCPCAGLAEEDVKGMSREATPDLRVLPEGPENVNLWQ